ALTLPDAPAGEPLRLVEITDRYADTGDLAAAKTALEKAHATPKTLWKALKSPRPREAPFAPGKVPPEDGHGGTAALVTLLPSGVADPGGCTAVISLHGRTLDGSSALGIGSRLRPPGRTIVLAPTAQKLPAGFEPDDIGKSFLDSVPHWWM